MNLKRIIRDAFIMISFCGTFYVSTFMWGKVEDKPPSNSNFSKSRVAADELVKSGRWEKAAVRYRRMTEDDPHNGYAWYRLGTSYNNVRFDAQFDIRVEKRSDTPSAQKIERLQETIAKYDELALEAHETARKFLRYRSKSLFQIAIIYADLNDNESALKYLREFVDGGYWTYHGLETISRLGSGGRSMAEEQVLVNSRTRLHASDEFWKLVAKERENRSKRKYPRRASKSSSKRNH